jgi:hypothetical protein
MSEQVVERAIKRRQVIIDSAHELIIRAATCDRESETYIRIKAQIEKLNEEALSLEKRIRDNQK